MSAFQRSFYREDPTLTIFRVLDDLTKYSGAAESSPCQRRPVYRRVFNPRFDVRETESAFELHGELPGINRENLNIEFTEPQTLVVRGRVARSYSSGTPPAAPVEDAQASDTATEGFEHIEPSEASHQASVEDEETEVAKEKGEAVETPAQPKAQPSPRKERYWHQERSTGEFHRTFKFQTRVDEEGVSATLENGILSITVPKAAKHEARRINIE